MKIDTIIRLLLLISVVLNFSHCIEGKFSPLDILEDDPTVEAYSYIYYEGDYPKLSVWSSEDQFITMRHFGILNSHGEIGGYLAIVGDLRIRCISNSSVGLSSHAGLHTSDLQDIIEVGDNNISIQSLFQNYDEIYRQFASFPDDPGIDEIRVIIKDLEEKDSDERPCWKSRALSPVLSFKKDIQFYDKGKHFRRK